MKTIEVKLLKNVFLSGVANLSNNKDYINELNVFPVPDGDTGTNMTMTVMSARKEVLGLESDAGLQEITKAIANGSLRGARGNSGVITSQIFRGFRKSLQNEGDLDEIDVKVLRNAVVQAAETAYKAVMKPKEGTILTVAKAAAKEAEKLVNDPSIDNMDIMDYIDKIYEAMERALEKTPELLPVLKQAGVVDSGGMGLLKLVEGFISALKGKPIELEDTKTGSTEAVKTEVKNTGIETEDIKFSYCTEFIIMTSWENEHNAGKTIDPDETEDELKEYLRNLGDCVVVVADEDIVKVHVHTNDPGLAIQKALTYGQLTSLKIDNMKEEHHEKIIKDAAKVAKEIEEEDNRNPKVKLLKQAEAGVDVAFVTISSGDGLTEIFKGLGVNVVVEGGQTMNPSTDDILDAINVLKAENIIVLPNNGNIILAAEQAARLAKDKKVYVIPSTNIPEGISTIINYIADRSIEENVDFMKSNLDNIKVGQVTYAVRDTEMDGFNVKKNNFMGMSGKSIVSVGKDAYEAAIAMTDSMIDEDSELVCLYYGADSSEEEAQKLAAAIEEKFGDVEVEVEYGGQPVYNYIVSVE